MSFEERQARLPNVTALWYHWQRLVERRVNGGMRREDAESGTTDEMIAKGGAMFADIDPAKLTEAMVACNDGCDELLYTLLYVK